MTKEPEVFEVLRKVRYDLTAAQAKVTDALNLLASMKLPAPPPAHPCPKCRLEFKGPRALAFHLANVHGGPVVPLTETEEAA